MAKFDEVFADLQAKMDAAMDVLAEYPEVAAEVRTALLGAQALAVEQAEDRADESRANVLVTMVAGVANKLAEAAPSDPE